ncbi:SagB family peptide dehydrogenase [Streptomyces tirandamycinicus]|uniref:SagB family peptide dehydrogenase n=1 Tax=Streptomyces tirandamycinicus TaxID=2174846 RepID=UPI002270F482|nr:SagB family peptide dehydrogenase [Streptomyces tirandamycinicus]MCY0985050.1 SagB family peptide dehydrogenase [Streptomyces tirandamycinicus]
MGYAHDYAAAIMRRGRVPMPPADFVPNWADGPRKTKFYPGADTVPLPGHTVPPGATVGRGLAPDHVGPGDVGPGDDGRDHDGRDHVGPGHDGRDHAGPDRDRPERPFDLPALSGMLRDSYGLTGRRLGVQANTDLDALPFHPLANWSRGTASGGGLYPVSVYWVSGPSGPLPPGVHYYATRQHALQRLLAGDVSGEVREALGDPASAGERASGTDQFLVLGVKYWQNAFKYNSFSFHAVTMDVGTVLQTWRIWARAQGLRVEPLMWFDERRLARLLGIRTEDEGVFAVVPLRWEGARARPAPPADTATVRRRDAERSRTVLTFDAVRRMQAATEEHAARRPAAGALAPAAAPVPDRGLPAVPLPAPTPLDTDVRTALRDRRSSFGRFDARRPLSAEHLASCLAAAADGASLGGDTGTGTTRIAGLYAFVGHTEGITPGAYAYDPAAHALRLVKAGPPGTFLQKNYFLANYNLEQTGAVLVPTVRTGAVLDTVGDRGYRIVNAVVGAISQSVYTAASALGVGCGVALGFDNVAYSEELGLEHTGESPLLIMMLGSERPAPADFRHEIA